MLELFYFYISDFLNIYLFIPFSPYFHSTGTKQWRFCTLPGGGFNMGKSKISNRARNIAVQSRYYLFAGTWICFYTYIHIVEELISIINTQQLKLLRTSCIKTVWKLVLLMEVFRIRRKSGIVMTSSKVVRELKKNRYIAITVYDSILSRGRGIVQ